MTCPICRQRPATVPDPRPPLAEALVKPAPGFVCAPCREWHLDNVADEGDRQARFEKRERDMERIR